MEKKSNCLYLIVIDTNKYSGNFERDMCAYATGQVGECGVGDNQAEIARREIPEMVGKIEEIIVQIPDEHGCHRPCEIYPTPGWFNSGLGGEFREGQEVEALKHYKKATRKCFEEQIKRLKSYKAKDGWTDEIKERDKKRHLERIAEADALEEPPKFPAYMSVAIYFNKKPSQEIIDVVKRRSAEFAKKEKIIISGYRLIEQKTSLTETAV